MASSSCSSAWCRTSCGSSSGARTQRSSRGGTSNPRSPTLSDAIEGGDTPCVRHTLCCQDTVPDAMTDFSFCQCRQMDCGQCNPDASRSLIISAYILQRLRHGTGRFLALPSVKRVTCCDEYGPSAPVGLKSESRKCAEVVANRPGLG